MSKCPTHIICGHRDISTNKNMANEFSKFFQMLVQILPKKITNPDKITYIYDYLGGRTGNCLHLKPVDKQKVISTAKMCTQKKA